LSDITDPRVAKSHEFFFLIFTNWSKETVVARVARGSGSVNMAGDVEGFALFAPPVGISEQVVIAMHVFF